jgi:hypothetical protein
MVEIAAIFQHHIRYKASVPVHIDCSDAHNLAERQVAGELLSLVPNGWRDSGQSIPFRQTRCGRPSCRTEIVSPSEIDTTFALNVCAMAGAARRKRRSACEQFIIDWSRLVG